MRQGLDGKDNNFYHCGDGEVKKGILEDLAADGGVFRDKVWSEFGESETQDDSVKADRRSP